MEESSGLSHDLMFVHQALSVAGINEIESAVLTLAAVAATVRDAVALLPDRDGISWDGDDQA